jgi:hypothetical protein
MKPSTANMQLHVFHYHVNNSAKVLREFMGVIDPADEIMITNKWRLFSMGPLNYGLANR